MMTASTTEALTRRRALAALFLVALLAGAGVPRPAHAGVALAMSGSFAGKVFDVNQGVTEALPGVTIVVFNQGSVAFQARLVVVSPPEIQLSLDQTILSLPAGGHQTVAVTAITVGQYALTGEHRLTVRAELVPGSAGNLTVSGAVAQSATLRVALGQGLPPDFADTRGHWGQQDIALMVQMGIARGVGEGQFAPDSPVTRAQFAAFLLRSMALPETSPATGHFRDVAPGAWYFGAIEAVYAAGLVRGYEDGLFRPDAEISREELAVMIARALALRGRSVVVQSIETVLARFSDRDAISSWAGETAAQVVQAGIIGGRANGFFAPRAIATRAEAVVMLKRMLGLLDLLTT